MFVKQIVAILILAWTSAYQAQPATPSPCDLWVAMMLGDLQSLSQVLETSEVSPVAMINNYEFAAKLYWVWMAREVPRGCDEGLRAKALFLLALSRLQDTLVYQVAAFVQPEQADTWLAKAQRENEFLVNYTSHLGNLLREYMTKHPQSLPSQEQGIR